MHLSAPPPTVRVKVQTRAQHTEYVDRVTVYIWL